MSPEAIMFVFIKAILAMSAIGFAFVFLYEKKHPSFPMKDSKTLKEWIRDPDKNS